MHRLVRLLFLAMIVVPNGLAEKLSGPQLRALVSCMAQKGADMGTPLPMAGENDVRLRYTTGTYLLRRDGKTIAQFGTPDTVVVAAYSRDQEHVVVYRTFLTKSSGRLKVELSYPSVYTKSRTGKWVNGDNPEGIATDLYLRDMLQRFAHEPALTLDVPPVAEGSCEVLPY